MSALDVEKRNVHVRKLCEEFPRKVHKNNNANIKVNLEHVHLAAKDVTWTGETLEELKGTRTVSVTFPGSTEDDPWTELQVTKQNRKYTHIEITSPLIRGLVDKNVVELSLKDLPEEVQNQFGDYLKLNLGEANSVDQKTTTTEKIVVSETTNELSANAYILDKQNVYKGRFTCKIELHCDVLFQNWKYFNYPIEAIFERFKQKEPNELVMFSSKRQTDTVDYQSAVEAVTWDVAGQCTFYWAEKPEIIWQ